MSDIRSLLSEEQLNRSIIHLHKEGLFYVAYERSCYAFYKYIKPFKLSKRYVKSAGQEVVKLGFPSSGLEKLMAGREWEQVSDKHVRITLNENETIEELAYSEWKKAVQMQPGQGGVATEAPKDIQSMEKDSLVRMILSFPLESRTPMDCMNFVCELKRAAINFHIN